MGYLLITSGRSIEVIMIDTIVFGIRNIGDYGYSTYSIREILLSIDRKKFKITPYNFKKRKRRNDYVPVYIFNYKIQDRHFSNRYVFIQFFRIGGTFKNYDLKIKSEVSHFLNFKEFFDFLLSLSSCINWGQFLEDSEIAEIHLKIDLNEEFETFKNYLIYPYARNPHILESYGRTFYISKNFYLYEKNFGVRLERRFKGNMYISKTLNIGTLGGLLKKGMELIFPFEKLEFLDLYNSKKKLSQKENECLSLVREGLNCKKFITKKTKSGFIKLFKNSLVNVKTEINKCHKHIFSRSIQPKLERFTINLKETYIQQKEEFFGFT